MKHLNYKVISLMLFFVLIFTYIPTINADVHSYILPITRDGKKMKKVAYNGWSGEYPVPVIDVNSKVDGSTEIKVYKSLRVLNKLQPCQIINGIYHPWSQTKHSVLRFYSIIDLEEYESLRSQTIDEQKINQGDTITQVRYLAENLCEGLLNSKKIKNKELEFRCDEFEDGTKFRRLPGEDQDGEFMEQWLQLKCKEGYTGFVQDKEILKFKDVKEGTFIQDGVVGPKQ